MTIDISIVIPIYKGKKYLEHLIARLKKIFINFEREYALQCEGIFVNDYPEEKLELQEEDRYFRLYNLGQNRGIHGARVYGYFKARGKYIVFLDQDDELSENYLISQKQSIGTADAIVCNGYRERLCIRGRRVIYANESQLEKVKCLDSYLIEDNCIISPGQVLIRKDAIPDLWTSKIMKTGGADDFFLWILMLKKKYRFKINKEKLFIRKEYGDNTSGKFSVMDESFGEMIEILEANEILQEAELEKLRKIKESKTNKRDSFRYLKMMQIYDYWMYLKNRKRGIEQFFSFYNIKKIAVYGMNYIGNRLYDELYDSSVHVLFGVDREGANIEYDIPIVTGEDPALVKMMEQVDAVIITIVDSYEEIANNIKKVCDTPVLFIGEILHALINENELQNMEIYKLC